MPSRRIAKINRAILETLSSTVLFELRDPRVKNVTILNVETTDDLRASKIHIGVRGDAKVQSLTLHGLESARGFLQSKIAGRLETRNTPILKFVLEPNWLATMQATSEGLQEAEATVAEADLATGEDAEDESSVVQASSLQPDQDESNDDANENSTDEGEDANRDFSQIPH